MTNEELVDAVAVEVMGWHKAPWESLFGTQYRWVDEKGRGIDTIRDWNPLTDMNDLWMVVRKMQADGWAIRIEYWDAENGYTISLWQRTSQKSGTARSVTINQAILQAALEASGTFSPNIAA